MTDLPLPPLPEPEAHPAWDYAGATEVVGVDAAKRYAQAYALDYGRMVRERERYIVEMLVAAGHVTAEEARQIAAAIRASRPE